MEALAGSQIRFVKLPGKKKSRRVIVEMAGKADLVKGVQVILERGARGLGLKEFIKTVDITEPATDPRARGAGARAEGVHQDAFWINFA